MMSKVILITGSNKGIGYEIAKQSGKLGFKVIISGRNETRLKAALERLHKEEISADTLKVPGLQPLQAAQAWKTRLNRLKKEFR